MFKVGYTGDPYVGCTDIDECGLEDYNTCPGGIHSNGMNMDLFADQSSYEYGPYHLGPADSDGTQVLIISHWNKT